MIGFIVSVVYLKLGEEKKIKLEGTVTQLKANKKTTEQIKFIALQVQNSMAAFISW